MPVFGGVCCLAMSTPESSRFVEPRNGLGIAALVLGLVGVLFGLVPLTGFIAVGLGITGLSLGFANRGRLKRGTATNRNARPRSRGWWRR